MPLGSLIYHRAEFDRKEKIRNTVAGARAGVVAELKSTESGKSFSLPERLGIAHLLWTDGRVRLPHFPCFITGL